CSANVHTNQNDHFLKANGHHHHMPSPEQIELRNLKQKVKDRVQVETNSVPKIYEKELARSNLSPTALILAPVATEAKSNLNRIRRKTTAPLPTSSEFEIPDTYRNTFNGELFIYFPYVISLLSGKLTAIYRQLLSELEYHAERLKLKFEPVHIMSDFEMSLIKAIKQKFPKAMHHGCFFHLCQSLYKEVQALDLAEAYLNDEDIRLACRSTMALALLSFEYI
ncbi:unnamed protein product, partial [Rotaria sp. Silwood2]